MVRLYEDLAYGPKSDAGCYWRETIADEPCNGALEADVSCDVAVIGAGYTGLNAAHGLARAGAEVVVLEENTPGWGASGRNGGFCCLGGAALEGSQLVKLHGRAATRAFLQAERAAVDHVAGLLDALGIEADRHSDGEVQLAHSPAAFGHFAEEAAFYREMLGLSCRVLTPEAQRAEGIAAAGTHGALHVPVGFALNPRKYAIGLAQAAQVAGVRIFTRSPVTSVDAAAGGFRLRAGAGEVRARKVIFATNGYSREDLPGWYASRYLPVQSNVIVTRPLTAPEREAQGWTSEHMAYDSRHLLHYFRLMPDGRFLFGMRGGVTAKPAEMARRKARIRADFEAMFPGWAHVETPHFWSGLLCVSRDLTPYVGPVPGMDGAYTALAYHGNGVAMGSYAGARLAEIVAGVETQAPLPDIMRRPLRRYPLGRARRLLLHAAYLAYGWKDRRS
ncbi:Gamma-glutamylputrescine oxidoreductase [Pseudoruegeria aquimaris]|uniref:Gamma-glutamylputrescine oxidoreductase n=1 Tax=Pseudoruegeria aquimaris TaxID=393663 RepID=A0A1Y5SGZ2_9RHOB|nr:FAD-dependent oxidoreductase [Pseudoruegeria aquimaris]SLN37675.1 Gamma-glutamylputrescine oxidoreductase [Pseudoruegeria aquimaris]